MINSRVITFPRHFFARCDDPKCCGCPYCLWGLVFCERCRGAEGSMPTDCPGEPMPDVIEVEVYAGRMDFRFGRGWVAASNAERGIRAYGTRRNVE